MNYAEISEGRVAHIAKSARTIINQKIINKNMPTGIQSNAQGVETAAPKAKISISIRGVENGFIIHDDTRPYGSMVAVTRQDTLKCVEMIMEKVHATE